RSRCTSGKDSSCDTCVGGRLSGATPSIAWGSRNAPEQRAMQNRAIFLFFLPKGLILVRTATCAFLASIAESSGHWRLAGTENESREFDKDIRRSAGEQFR